MSEDYANMKVSDRQSFIKFIALFRKDLTENSAEWENKTLEDFLSAVEAYTEDIQGYYNNTKQHIDANQANWQTFADIFKGARVYE